ncbi:ABC transporter permease [Lichenihabitans sp. Uapishka_5]|uniref:ABC transporter permease n=1 Tax=Lichenihabitans sp. Uapishka_5 TaxID=3037302 RepID=UPI0029E7E38D|nr:ABC transporter permease [Lichenihabitans sp. Uapishka_5]MDX7953493.1 ABC transporter permease [Lichenihabitans sp. Uapishka_5]
MRRTLSRLAASPQGIMLATGIVLAIAFSIINPVFLSAPNLVDLLRNSIVTGIFAIGVLIVLASGGIDVSFTAIGAFSLYATTKLLIVSGIHPPMVAIFAIGIAIGVALGLVNGLLIGLLGLPTLIVTLATLSLFRGALLTFVGTLYYGTIPAEMVAYSRQPLLAFHLASGRIVQLPMAFLNLVLVATLVALILSGTMFGRKIYALGGSEEAAERIGINVRRVKLAIFMLAGGIAGLAGVTHVTLMRIANPFDLVGSELNVIAAVVLGGARITGGHGTVSGTIIGVLVITIINSSLLLIGVPTYWQRLVVGALILLGTGLPIAIERYNLHRARLRAVIAPVTALEASA